MVCTAGDSSRACTLGWPTTITQVEASRVLGSGSSAAAAAHRGLGLGLDAREAQPEVRGLLAQRQLQVGEPESLGRPGDVEQQRVRGNHEQQINRRLAGVHFRTSMSGAIMRPPERIATARIPRGPILIQSCRGRTPASPTGS
jgi:hypothetical protein